MRHEVRQRSRFTALLCGLAVGYGVLFGLPVVAAKLYVWYDEQGTPHYTDQPRPGAKEIHVQSAQGYSSPPAAAPGARASAPAAAQPRNDAAPASPYSRVEIVQPADDEAIVNTGGRVDVVVELEPELAPGHRTWFLLDGVPQTDVQNGATQVTLEAARGTHTLRFRITDRDDAEIAASKPITFHVVQNSIANPPVGPKLRPPPKKP